MKYKSRHLIVEAKQFDFSDESRDEIVRWSNGDIKINSQGGLRIPYEGYYREVFPSDFVIKDYNGKFHCFNEDLFNVIFSKV